VADSYIEAPPDSTGKKIDTDELTIGANIVERQRIQALTPTLLISSFACLASATNTVLAQPGAALRYRLFSIILCPTSTSVTASLLRDGTSSRIISVTSPAGAPVIIEPAGGLDWGTNAEVDFQNYDTSITWYLSLAYIIETAPS
jgi:hypothetical protein